jgi:hypothetical protein
MAKPKTRPWYFNDGEELAPDAFASRDERDH